MPSHRRWERYSWKIRTLVLLFVGIWGAFGPTVVSPDYRVATLRLVGVAACANFLIWFSLQRSFQRAVSLAVLLFDLFLAYYCIYLTGGIDSPLYIVFFMPLITAAILFGPVGAYVAFLGVSLLYGIAAATVSELNADRQMVLLARVFLLGITAMLATYISQEEKRRTFELNSLRRISRTITGIAELSTALKELVSAISDVLDVEKVLFMLYDPATDMLVAQEPSFGLTEEQLAAARLPRGTGVSWEVFDSGESLLIQNAEIDPRTSKELVGIHGTRSMLTVALKVKNEYIGVVHTINRRDGAPFTERDMDLLELLSVEAALILDHARLHRAVLQERGTLDAILHSIRSGVVVTNTQGKVILVNHEAERFLGKSEQHLLNGAVERAVSDPALREFFLRAIREERHFTSEVTLETIEDTVLRLDSSPVADDTGARLGQVTILSDITDWKNLDRMKTEFIATVSHELRTPLTSIKAYAATLLRSKTFDIETQSSFLNVINDQCDRLTRLINDLLDIARLERGEKLRVEYSPVDLKSLIEKVVKSEGTFAGGQELEVTVHESARTLETGEQQLERVLANLVNNALKYSPGGSRVVVAARPCEFDDRSILLLVRDQGIGIPTHRQEAIFNKFYQLDSRRTRHRGGSGLGLYLVQHLVEALHGKIWVESEPGHGATFHVQLPRNRPSGD
ncbi:MAG: hypothetical protein AUJ92_13365 [Armatimonadetes bacterium CG2_30_59_28]|nr:GAF domain-containing protein [Armatimonadota bacterium]OIO92845.1 MAG: hypothetical protein AUJ92_13365 [Armatimonadetes bacterium CG2_30_59_28]PIU64264.1 MAG: hypothetical protein COS85_13150 [Armatimonadetes bacterium CG07_land_8_20_14_0_80_59_28]PIX38430.1 MAG: hypothetical protein COZ56_20475 [Armatimonadetes bacterium CG_4_8_14_3_um_filter_58_9]PIY43449.1 MAG: hypothetical protein COZ05_11025 [Armatimonadetes bacterium CG_4_10_14_3_um_filter_59_10]